MPGCCTTTIRCDGGGAQAYCLGQVGPPSILTACSRTEHIGGTGYRWASWRLAGVHAGATSAARVIRKPAVEQHPHTAGAHIDALRIFVVLTVSTTIKTTQPVVGSCPKNGTNGGDLLRTIRCHRWYL